MSGSFSSHLYTIGKKSIALQQSTSFYGVLYTAQVFRYIRILSRIHPYPALVYAIPENSATQPYPYRNGEYCFTVSVAFVSEDKHECRAPVDKNAKSTWPLRNSMTLPCRIVFSVVERTLYCNVESMKLPFCRTPAEIVWPGISTGAIRII